jgi:hypothetical protein
MVRWVGAESWGERRRWCVEVNCGKTLEPWCCSLSLFGWLAVVCQRGHCAGALCSVHVPRPGFARPPPLLHSTQRPVTALPPRVVLRSVNFFACCEGCLLVRASGDRRSEVKEENWAKPSSGERARTQTVLWTVCAWRAPGALSPGMSGAGHPMPLPAPCHAGTPPLAHSNARRLQHSRGWNKTPPGCAPQENCLAPAPCRATPAARRSLWHAASSIRSSAAARWHAPVHSQPSRAAGHRA